VLVGMGTAQISNEEKHVPVKKGTAQQLIRNLYPTNCRNHIKCGFWINRFSNYNSMHFTLTHRRMMMVINLDTNYDYKIEFGTYV